MCYGTAANSNWFMPGAGYHPSPKDTQHAPVLLLLLLLLLA
jgi:hypothetical protein